MGKIKYLSFFMMLLCICAFQPSYAEDPPLPTPVGRVVWVTGELRAVMPNNEQRILQKTSVIYLKDTLITDKNTKAEIIFSDQTIVSFRPETRFYVDEFSYKPQAKKGSVGKYIMQLIEGGFRTVTGLIGKDNPKNYQVNTPVATIGVRGTDYTVYVRNGELYVGFYTGVPCVKNKKGEICLDKYNKYVKASDSELVRLNDEPFVLKDKLEITPANISPFYSGSSGVNKPIGGVISSFCISQ